MFRSWSEGEIAPVAGSTCLVTASCWRPLTLPLSPLGPRESGTGGTSLFLEDFLTLHKALGSLCAGSYHCPYLLFCSLSANLPALAVKILSCLHVLT